MDEIDEMVTSMENYNQNTSINKEFKESPISELELSIGKVEQEYNEYNAIVSYYTYLPECTGNGLGITASGVKVSETSVAIPRKDNVLKFGTKIEFVTLAPKYMEDYDGKYLTRIADDTGSPKYIRKMENGTYRLDVFCPKLPNETDKEYHKRVNSYGKTQTKIKVYK